MRRGFTLIELMIALALAAVLLPGAAMVLDQLGDESTRITKRKLQGDDRENGRRLLRGHLLGSRRRDRVPFPLGSCGRALGDGLAGEHCCTGGSGNRKPQRHGGAPCRDQIVRARTTRQGFAMLAVLWVMLGASAVAMVGALAGRESVNAARNRISAERAYWRARECELRVRFIVDSLLSSESDPRASATLWRSLAPAVEHAQPDSAAECGYVLEPSGARLDLNAADSGALHRILGAAGHTATADAMTDAILDWRDADDIVRPLGAESSEYRALRTLAPRNGPFASVRELGQVRGFGGVEGLDQVFTIEMGRVAINSAAREVLAAIPGFTAEVIEHLLRLRAEGSQVANLLDLSVGMSADARDAIMANYPQIERMAAVDPDAWILTAFARDGLPPIQSTIELRLIRSGPRAAVMRRRAW
jgi:general secretion pathway protein K